MCLELCSSRKIERVIRIERDGGMADAVGLWGGIQSWLNVVYHPRQLVCGSSGSSETQLLFFNKFNSLYFLFQPVKNKILNKFSQGREETDVSIEAGFTTIISYFGDGTTTAVFHLLGNMPVDRIACKIKNSFSGQIVDCNGWYSDHAWGFHFLHLFDGNLHVGWFHYWCLQFGPLSF